jgi:sugar lactone lactonase YvrE
MNMSIVSIQQCRFLFAPAMPRVLALIGVLFASTTLLAQSAHYEGAQTVLGSSGVAAYGVAVDSQGNVWVADNYTDVVQEISPAGIGSQTFSLNGPWGIAVDVQGNVYIAETGSNDVIKETATHIPNGTVYTRSVLPTNGLSFPTGLAIDSHGKIYVGDTDNFRVIVLTPSGSSYTQSTLPTSPQVQAVSIAVDAGGSVYVADSANNRVLKETPSGTGYTESIVAQQLAEEPGSVAVDGQGNVYISAYTPGDFGTDSFLVKEIPVAGGYQQVPAAFVENTHALGLAVDPAGDLYTAGGKLVFGAGVFAPTNTLATNASVSLVFLFDSTVTLGSPAVLTQGAPKLDFQDTRSGLCTYQSNGPAFTAGQACSVNVGFTPQWPGPRYGAVVLQDATGNALASGYVYGTGVGPEMTFSPATPYTVSSGIAGPGGLVVDGRGNIFFAESGSGLVYKGTRSGNSYALTEVASGLNQPTAVALDGNGNLYVAATNTVYKETPVGGGWVQSAPVSVAGELTGIAVDGSGNLYVTSSASGDVHKETLQTGGNYVESGLGYGITHPAGVAVDGQGNVYVADPQQGEVYLETLLANATYRQSILASGLASPEGVALDGGGSVYITSSSSGHVYKEGLQTDGTWLQTTVYSGLDGPNGIALDEQGNLYVSLEPARQIEMIDVADPPVIDFAKTPVGSTSADSPQNLTVTNAGNGGLNFISSLSSSFTFDPSTTCPMGSGNSAPLLAGGSCDYAIDFVPAVSGLIRGRLGLQYENFSQLFAPTITTKDVELREAGITSDATRTMVRVSPASGVDLGEGIVIYATVTDQSHANVVPEGGGVTFTDTLSGKVTALNGGAAVPLVDGKATLNVTPTVAGQHTISAHYAGVDASYASSTGAAAVSVFK